jgi:hypothetical protein
VRGLSYTDGTINGVQTPDGTQQQSVGYTEDGVSLRLEDRFGPVRHTIRPRAGIQLISAAEGDETLPNYNFGDTRDRLEADKRYYVGNLDTAFALPDRTLFRADVQARWGMRLDDLVYVDDNGQKQTGPTSLVDVTGTFDGKPVPPVDLTGSFRYDALRSRWDTFESTVGWRVVEQLRLSDTSTLLPPSGGSKRAWSHTPGATVYAKRYTFESSFTLRDQGKPVDGWLLHVARRMVDGIVFVGYEAVWSSDNTVLDRRYSLGFSLSSEPDQALDSGSLLSLRQ